jgi:hypothetical protein
VCLNFSYTFVLRHQPVIDIFIIAIGFVLRVLACAVALNALVSDRMLVTTLCLALYFAAIKRGQELIIAVPFGFVWAFSLREPMGHTSVENLAGIITGVCVALAVSPV